MAHHVDFVLDHPIGADQQILDRDVLFDGVGGAIELARAIPGQFEHHLAQGLGRNCAKIDAAPTDHGLPLDHGDFFVELRALDRRPLAGRPGADHQKIVVERAC